MSRILRKRASQGKRSPGLHPARIAARGSFLNRSRRWLPGASRAANVAGPVLATAMKTDYLEAILNARVYDVAAETPLELATSLSARLDNRVLLKREDMQPVFSFKLRGAYNKMVGLAPAQLRRGRDLRFRRQSCPGGGLRCAAARVPRRDRDAGDHPAHQGRCGAARGARVLLHGDSYDEAYAHSLTVARRERLTFVHPYDDPDGDRRAGDGRHGDPARAQRADRRHLRRRGRRRSDRRRRRLRQALAPGGQDHRRGADRVGRHDAFAGRRPSGEARPGRAVRRRRGGAAGREGDLPPVPRAGRRDDPGGQRRHLRRHQGRLRGDPRDPGAGRGAGGGRAEGVGRAAAACADAPWSRSLAAPT